MATQQWELLASKGHVLLSRIDVYRLKLPKLVAIAGAGVVFAFAASYPVGALVGEYTGSAAGAIAGFVSGIGATTHEKNPAPTLASIRPVVPRNFSININSTANLERDVLPEMRRVLSQELNKGIEFKDCDFGRKINENWATVDDIAPRCRYSDDKNRLWVWSIINHQNELNGWVGLFRRENAKSPYKFYEVKGTSMAHAKDAEGVILTNILRTLASDFPELKGDKK